MITQPYKSFNGSLTGCALIGDKLRCLLWPVTSRILRLGLDKKSLDFKIPMVIPPLEEVRVSLLPIKIHGYIILRINFPRHITRCRMPGGRKDNTIFAALTSEKLKCLPVWGIHSHWTPLHRLNMRSGNAKEWGFLRLRFRLIFHVILRPSTSSSPSFLVSLLLLINRRNKIYYFGKNKTRLENEQNKRQELFLLCALLLYFVFLHHLFRNLLLEWVGHINLALLSNGGISTDPSRKS